jgi:hypothetical protein
MEILPAALHNELYLVIGPHSAQLQMLELAARLAEHTPLRVLDGGNRFNVYLVAQAVRRHTSQLRPALERIRVARAFTCHQVLALLADTPALPGQATLVLDLLSTFYDESVRLPEALRLLEGALGHLRRLSAAAPVVVSARPPLAAQCDRLPLLGHLQAAAAQTAFWPEEQPEDSLQPALF